MAFWGVKVKPGKPFTLKATTTNDAKRLHLSQATLGMSSMGRSILQCNVGNQSPLFLCVLSPEKVDSCQLNIEFQEAEDVTFSVIGLQSVHLTGYFLARNNCTGGFMLNDDDSESFGEDIADTDGEKYSSDDYDYSDSFINDGDDDDPSARPSHKSTSEDDDLSDKERVASKTKVKKINKRLRKKFEVSDLDSVSDEDSVEMLNNDNDHKIPKVASSEVPLPSMVTSSSLENCEKISEATSPTHNAVDNKKEDKTSGDVELGSDKPSMVTTSSLENCEKISEATTPTHNAVDNKKEDKPSGDVELGSDKPSMVTSSSLENCEKISEATTPTHNAVDNKKEDKPSGDVELGSDELPKKKESVVINTDEGGEKDMPGTHKAIESSTDGTLSKKKRKKKRREETTGRKKQAMEQNLEKEAKTKILLESEISSNEVTIEEIEKGELDGKVAVQGKTEEGRSA